MRSRAITIILTILAVMTAGLSVAYQQKRAQLRPGRVSGGEGIVLPVGWRITPAGRQVALPGDMAMKIIVSPDGRQYLFSILGNNLGGDGVSRARKLQEDVVTRLVRDLEARLESARDGQSPTRTTARADSPNP